MLSDRLDEAVFDRVGHAVALLLLPSAAAFLWVRESWGKPPAVRLGLLPICVSTTAVFAEFAGLIGRKSVGKVRDLRLGLLAERVVGQQLERSRAFRHSVFHDTVCEKGALSTS